MTVETLVRPWEKMVMGMQFTEVSQATARIAHTRRANCFL